MSRRTGVTRDPSPPLFRDPRFGFALPATAILGQRPPMPSSLSTTFGSREGVCATAPIGLDPKAISEGVLHLALQRQGLVFARRVGAQVVIDVLCMLPRPMRDSQVLIHVPVSRLRPGHVGRGVRAA